MDSEDPALQDLILISTEIPGAFDIDFQHPTSYSSFNLGDKNITNSTNETNSTNTSEVKHEGNVSRKRSRSNYKGEEMKGTKNSSLNSSRNFSNETHRFVFHNVLRPDNCRVNMVVGPTKQPALGNLTINCTSECFILQLSKKFHVKDSIHIDGTSDVYFNSIDLKTKVFNFSATKGLVQLNHFEIEKYANISLKDGNVILQSTKDFSVNWTHSVPSYCFSAPFFSSDPEIEGDRKSVV